MATLEHIAIRRADAEARIATAAGVIAGALGVDPPVAEAAHPMAPYPAELGAALYAEAVAAYLERVAKALADELAKPTADADEPDKAEPDAAMAALNRLVYAAADDKDLRDVLVARGYLQAKEGPDGASVSWVGIGPDLTPLQGDQTTMSDETKDNNPTQHVDADGTMQPLDKPAAHAPDGGGIAGKDAGGDFGATTLADVGAAPATGGETPVLADAVPEAPKTAKKGG